MNNLVNYGWIYTFNPVTGNWRACTRDRYLDLFSRPETEFIRSPHIEDLQALIIKNNGDPDKIKELI